jgi:hypothetical protein
MFKNPYGEVVSSLITTYFKLSLGGEIYVGTRTN